MAIDFTRLKSLSSDLSHLSVVMLVAANLVPLYSVLFLGWEVFPLLFLYWLENVIIGVFNVLKMLLCKPDDAGTWLGKIFIIPFFCFHYGMFTLVHGIFVFGFFGGYFTQGAPIPDEASVLQALWSYNLGWVALDLAVSHGISFAVNYVKRGEYRQTSLRQLMEQPYGRVVVMHLTILGGGFLMMMLNSPVAGLIVLVLLKIILDVRAHVREHFKDKSKRAELHPG